ncbi:hypothetical protein [Brachybacterium sp. NPDC056505]|uniref:hypothetical protein n=1 Tax=Brachybacterium sp. NPDC056505 TaxID=3345843 RepID=UPI00366F393D
MLSARGAGPDAPPRCFAGARVLITPHEDDATGLRALPADATLWLHATAAR